ncbi:MAG: DcaP family trimeric outer membrane transporter [Pseudomonadota bacterium]
MSPARLHLSPLAAAARALCVTALLCPAAAMAQSAAASDTAAAVRELRQRLEVLEAQLATEKAARASPPSAAAAKPAEVKLGETKITWGGYVKADAIYSSFSEGEVAQSTARDFYLPNGTPVSNGSGKRRDFTDFHAKESRLFVKSETMLDGHKLGTHIELDFIVNQSATANEIVTNAYTPGFRRAFITYDNVLVGQEWTTFLNLGSLPETLDFVAFPSEGSVFVRQAQARYTLGSFQFAVENPETSVLPGGGGAVAGAGDAVLPDFIARYNLKLGAAELSLSGLVRQLKLENPAAGATAAVDDKTTGAGVSLAGKITFGSDDLKFQLTTGEGIGRYMALGTSADAVLSAGELDAIGITGGYLAYKHAWTPQWRSTITASALAIDNDTARTGTGLTKKVQSASINLLYSPVAKLTFGAEYRHAERELENGQDGDLDRLQFSAKYSF